MRAFLVSILAAVVIAIAAMYVLEQIWQQTSDQAFTSAIIMASHGRRGIERLLLGSVAHEVLVRSTILVLICR